jgi:hypothetical protein
MPVSSLVSCARNIVRKDLEHGRVWLCDRQTGYVASIGDDGR